MAKTPSLELIIEKLDQLDAQLGRVNEQMTKLDTQGGNLGTHMNQMSITLAQQKLILDEHIRRTNVLEDHVADYKVTTDAQLKPINTHMAVVGAFIKLIGVAGALVGLVAGIKAIF